MRQLPYDLLRVLVAVAESPNFRAAAERLQISQPAVTFKLKELEATQPLPIFNMEGRRKVLTHYGRALYQVAKTGADQLSREIENLHRNYSSAKSLTVRIAGRGDLLKFLASWFEFDGRIEFVNCSSTEATEKLLRHEIDVAISYVLPDSTAIHAKKLFRSRTFFRIHEDLLGKRKLDGDLLKDREFLKTTPCISLGHGAHVWSLLPSIGLSVEDLNVKFITDDWATVQKLVADGLGYGILPFYIPNEAKKVRELLSPPALIESLDFYALFEANMRKLEAFRTLLAFTKLKEEAGG